MGVSEIRGTLFWGPYNKDTTIYGTTLGSPIFGNSYIFTRMIQQANNVIKSTTLHTLDLEPDCDTLLGQDWGLKHPEYKNRFFGYISIVSGPNE